MTAAFAAAEHSSGTEAAIVDGLRDANALSISLVAEDHGQVLGHIAFSPVTVGGGFVGWYGLGPVAVRPDAQRRGIGQALIRSGIERLQNLDARGCVVLGNPAYYARFGFSSDSSLHYGEVPVEFFMRLGFGDDLPAGMVGYHAAFSIA